MKWLAIAVVLLLPLMAVTASAANPGDATAGLGISISPGDVAATPDMWFYEQYLRQYQDPKLAVRRRAEFRADQRDKRLAAQRWFGVFNSRPTVGTEAYHSDYAPRWSSNNRYYPFRWQGVGSPVVIVQRSAKSPY